MDLIDFFITSTILLGGLAVLALIEELWFRWVTYRQRRNRRARRF